jgi:uncharacterized protein YjbJ (UPF0337 family)
LRGVQFKRTFLRRLNPSAPTNERHEEQDDKDHETDLGHPCRRSGHAAKAQDSGDQRHHEKRQCPAQHIDTFPCRFPSRVPLGGSLPIPCTRPDTPPLAATVPTAFRICSRLIAPQYTGIPAFRLPEPRGSAGRTARLGCSLHDPHPPVQRKKPRSPTAPSPFPDGTSPAKGGTTHRLEAATPGTTHFNIMNRHRFCGTWTIVKGKLKQGWARMIGNDRRYLGGREQEFNGRIQRCVGRVRDGAQTRIVRTIRLRTAVAPSSNRTLIRPLRILPPSGRSTSFRDHGQ